MDRRPRLLLRLLCAVALLASCTSRQVPDDERSMKDDTSEGDVQAPATLDDIEPVATDQAPEMDITLSDGSRPGDEPLPKLERPPTEPLSAARTEAILSRMSPLVAEPSDRADFARRARSLPPPKTGEVVEASFPPAESRQRPEGVDDADAPLEVLRYAPEGEVPIAPHVSVTFSQPMVDVTSHGDTTAEGVPVELSPMPQGGQWRWVGSKTLLFERGSGERLPMATEYSVRVPKGTAAATGQTLSEATAFTFSTPPVELERSWPPSYAPQPRDPILFMQFNQRVEPAEIVEHVKVKTGTFFGRHTVELVEASELKSGELEAEELPAGLAQLVDQAPEGRWVAFRTTEPLPYDSQVEVVLTEGAPSAEGPLRSTSPQSFRFRTFGPMEVVEHRCTGYRECTPNDSFWFRLSNSIDTAAFDAAMVRVEPSFPGMQIHASGNYINVSGYKPGRRTYEVTLSAELPDTFGQTLGADASFEFEVGSAWPSIAGAGGNMVVLDPASPPAYEILTVNYAAVRVAAYRVGPDDWPAYGKYLRDWNYYGKHQKEPPGKRVMRQTVKIDAEPDEPTRTQIALDDPLGGDGLGHLVLVIEPTEVISGAPRPDRMPVVRKWVQATKIGLDAFVDATEMIAWATRLGSGEPLEGVELALTSRTKTSETDAEGIATFALPKSADASGALVATSGDDVAMLPEDAVWGQSSSWHRQSQPNQLTWYVIDDRQMYKPGESVHLKGWVRITEAVEQGGLKLPEGLRSVEYVVTGPQRNEIARGTADATALGGFDLSFELPATPNLGHATVELRSKGASATSTVYRHSFQIQEFRTPEFEVTASASEGPHFAGSQATATVEASYYAGGALPNAQVNWRVTHQASSYRPPNNDDFTFGTWTPWWVHSQPHAGATGAHTLESRTDVTGLHHLDMDFGAISPPRPMTVRAEATVMDVNRQAWSASTNLLVHPSTTYVGLRTETYFVDKGEPLAVELVVTDLDGKRLADRPVKVRAARVDWEYDDGRYREKLVDPQDCEVMTTGEGSTCTFETEVGGRYKIIATTRDDWGRQNYTELTRWVTGGGGPVARSVEQEDVQLIPDQDDYQPGQTAKILVQAPFAPAEGLLTLRRNGITHQRRFTMDGSSTTLEVDVAHTHVPNVYVQVDLVGSAPRLGESGEPDDALPRRPAFASGQLNLKVPPTQRVLDIALAPADDAVEPGATTSVDVTVTDAAGEPVAGAEVALIVVDEAILALSNYALADPIDVFYQLRPTGARDHHLREHVTLADVAQLRELAEHARPQPEAKGRMMKRSTRGAPAALGAAGAPMEMAEADAAPMMDGMAPDFGGAQQAQGGEAAQAIAVRTNFDPLAAFAPAKTTDEQGRARLAVDMPDNLTRYRIMAVAVHDDDRFGSAEDHITARLPLMVRPSAPRFLNFGDQFKLPVVLQNQTREPMVVEVATRATNVSLDGAAKGANQAGLQVEVPAGDRVEVLFGAETDMTGTARFQIGAVSGPASDASEFSLPVWTPATSEAFATYGTIDDGAAHQGTVAQPVKLPTDVYTQFGGLQVTTSSTALQELTDAFLYIYDYEYECAEQIASRVLTIAALRDVLQAFEAEGMPSKPEVARSMERDIEELASRQNHDGGFGFWRRGQRSWPFISLHATHALVRAEQKGYAVPDHVMQRAKRHLQHIERYIPHWYSESTRRFVLAYALYVRDQMGDTDVAGARALLARAKGPDGLAFEAVGWLLGVMTGHAEAAGELATLRRYLSNRVTETAGAAHFAVETTDQDYVILHSNRRADGVVLEALIADQPKSDLIPKIVRGLLAHRTRGRWSNTQENVFILLALDRYFNAFEGVTPDFVARVWLGDAYAGEHAFEGRTTEQHRVDIPLGYLSEEPENLYLQKDGKGRLYYRIAMDYAPKSLELDPADHGFVVERAYEAVDDPGDVTRRDDGTWQIKAGAKVRVKLTMVAPTRRYHVALVDPLPAGLEVLNPALATTGDLPEDAGGSTTTTGGGTHRIWWWWTRPWFEHQNMRDERVEAFSTLVWGGVHSYTYYARATTPGRFVVPPTKAEEMYHPETFGRTGTTFVEVVD